jgi:hypothetical protein
MTSRMHNTCGTNAFDVTRSGAPLALLPWLLALLLPPLPPPPGTNDGASCVARKSHSRAHT